MTLLLAGIMTPIMEEIFYRGILLGKLRQGFGIGVAAMHTSSVFWYWSHESCTRYVCSDHGRVIWLCGDMDRYVCYTSIVLHMVINSTSILWRHLMPVQLDGGQLEIVILIGAALMIIGLWLLSQTSKREGHNIYGFKS